MKHLEYVLPILLFLPSLGHSQEKPGPEVQAKILGTQELTNQADVVALGKVTALTSEWNVDRSRIYTRARIEVHEFLKGNGTNQSLTVVTPGGEVGDVGEIYSFAARFQSNEEVVVFARKRKGGDHEVVGGNQGRIPVIEEKSSGEKTVFRGIPLNDFRSAIRSGIQVTQPGEKKP